MVVETADWWVGAKVDRLVVERAFRSAAMRADSTAFQWVGCLAYLWADLTVGQWVERWAERTVALLAVLMVAKMGRPTAVPLAVERVRWMVAEWDFHSVGCWADPKAQTMVAPRAAVWACSKAVLLDCCSVECWVALKVIQSADWREEHWVV